MIVDLVTAASAAPFAVLTLTTWPDWWEIGFAALATAATGLGVLAGILLIHPRTAFAARLGEVASGIFVVLFLVLPFWISLTCEGLGCVAVWFGVPVVFMAVLVGIVAWSLNRNAYDDLELPRAALRLKGPADGFSEAGEKAPGDDRRDTDTDDSRLSHQ